MGYGMDEDIGPCDLCDDILCTNIKGGSDCIHEDEETNERGGLGDE